MNISQNTFSARVEEIQADPELADLQSMIDSLEVDRKATQMYGLRFEIITAQIVKLKMAREARIQELLK